MKTLWRRNNSFFLLALLAVACQNFANESSVITADGAIETRAVDSEGQDYYWYQGKKVYLTTDKNYVNVIIEDAVMKFPELNPLFDKANVESDNRKTFDGVVKLKFKSGKASASEYSKTVAALKQNGQIKSLF